MRGETLGIGFAFTNDEPELTEHLDFGRHPCFVSTRFESVELEMPAGHYRRWFSPNNYLSGETEEIEFEGGAMPFERAKLPGSYILELVDVPKRNFVFHDQPSGREVVIDLGDAPYLTLWSDGSAFLCVEPCWGLTDRHEQRAFEAKEGIQTIPAGGRLKTSFTIAPALRR